MASKKPSQKSLDETRNAAQFTTRLARLGKDLIHADEVIRAATAAERDCDALEAEVARLKPEVQQLQVRKDELEAMLPDLEARVQQMVDTEKARMLEEVKGEVDAEVEAYRVQAAQTKSEIAGEIETLRMAKTNAEAEAKQAEQTAQAVRAEVRQLEGVRDNLRKALAGAVQ